MKSDFLKNLSEFYLIKFFIYKVLVATICGLIIGWERELKHKAAGIRTNVLVAVSSCILTAVSFLICDYYVTDPTRIIGQIVSGLGFIGAGIIWKSGDKISGVTTAAFIWFMCAIGVLAGTGMVLVPIFLTIGILFISIKFQKLEGQIHKDQE